jgi:hypothetical protein
MSIQVAREKLVSFSQLARQLPSQRRGRPVHISTVHRWRHPGLRGVRLEAIRIGGNWHTSWEAFQRFCELLSGGRAEERADQAPIDANASAAVIDAELDCTGW